MDTWGEDPCGVYPAGVPLAPSGLEDTDWTPTTTMESTGVPEYKAYQLAGQRIEGVNMKNAPVGFVLECYVLMWRHVIEGGSFFVVRYVLRCESCFIEVLGKILFRSEFS